MSETVAGSASPAEVARATVHGMDAAGDAADQAERLTMIMEAEATHNALNGGGGEGDTDGLPYPLEDIEDVLAMEDAEDSSDDPMHSGGLTPAPWMPAEQAAMHVVDPDDPEDDAYVGRRERRRASRSVPRPVRRSRPRPDPGGRDTAGHRPVRRAGRADPVSRRT